MGAGKVISVLGKEYPGASITLDFGNRTQMVVGVILSAQCTDKRVNEVGKTLFKRYRTFSDFAGCDLRELEREIYSTGFYHNKAKNIKACCKMIVEKFSGRLPGTMEELLTIPGIGRKSANVILSNAFRKNEGVVVDTHVFRLARRLGLSKGKTAEAVERDLMAAVPRKKWLAVSNLLVRHGREICRARGPECGKCVLNKSCPSAFKIRT
jgi:endonuclease-3